MRGANKKLPKIKEYIHIFSKKPKIKINPVVVSTNWRNVLDRYNNYLIIDKENPHDYSKWQVKSLNKAFLDNNVITEKEKNNFVLHNANFIFRTARNKSKQIQELPNDKTFRKIKTSTGLEKYVYKKEEVLFASDKLENNDFVDPVGDIWSDIGINNLHNEGTIDFQFGKKPEKLLQRVIEMATVQDDIVLDYHLGSGTTTAVAHKMDRQYIGIEQMDYVEDIAVERQKKVIAGEQGGISQSVEWHGGGDFIYCELAKWNERAKEQIQECENLEELIDFFDDIYDQYFLNYTLKVKEFKEKVIHEQTFRDLALEEQKKIFMAMLDNNQMYVNKSEMADKKYGIPEEDQRLSDEFYEE